MWDVDALQVRVCDGHKLARLEGYLNAVHVGLDSCRASSLAVLPGGEYVAVGGNESGTVSLIGVTDETFHNQNISVDVDSYIEQMDQLEQPGTLNPHYGSEAINSIVVHGVEKSYGSGNAAGWKLWVATSSLELVAIDPDRFECVERISLAANNCEWTLLYCPLASYGHILALDSGRSAITLFDTRCTSSARQEPIGVIFNRCEDSFEDSVVEHPTLHRDGRLVRVAWARRMRRRASVRRAHVSRPPAPTRPVAPGRSLEDRLHSTRG